MLLLRRPTTTDVRAFINAQRSLPFSYSEVGASRVGAPPGYPINRHRRQVGTGETTFKRAVAALQCWGMYELGWTQLYWPATPVAVGSVVAVQARLGLIWSLNACRVIYVLEEDGPVHRWGFAFGTLPDHLEQGEERFTVEWHRHNDAVYYELFAFAAAKHPLAKLGYPFTRLVQKRFAWESARAIERAANKAAT